MSTASAPLGDDRQLFYAGRPGAAAPASGVFKLHLQQQQALVGLPSSCDGIIEYTADTFQGQIRGDLLVHQWNSKIHRVNLDSTGRVVTGVSNIQSLAGLSLVQGPGGAVLSLDYTSSRVRVLEPNDSSAIGLKMFDILPWRAPATGGTFFRIGEVRRGGKARPAPEQGQEQAAELVASS